MINKSPIKTLAAALFFATFLLPSNTVYGWPNAHDPTFPSSKIAERLALTDDVELPASNTRAKKPAWDELHLTAIVLRTKDEGTALLSLGNPKNYVVQLRRKDRFNAAIRLTIRGIPLEVIDFSNSSIVLQNLDTKKRMVVHGRSSASRQ